MRRLLPVVVIAGLVFMAGCTQCEQTNLLKVDWVKAIGQHLDCRDDKVAQVSKAFHDVTGDGRDEAFVVMRCLNGKQPQAGQLEAFDGSSDPEHPKRLKVLVHKDDGLRLDGNLAFCGPRVIIPEELGSESASSWTWQKDALRQDEPAATCT